MLGSSGRNVDEYNRKSPVLYNPVSPLQILRVVSNSNNLTFDTLTDFYFNLISLDFGFIGRKQIVHSILRVVCNCGSNF